MFFCDKMKPPGSFCRHILPPKISTGQKREGASTASYVPCHVVLAVMMLKEEQRRIKLQLRVFGGRGIMLTP